MDALRANAADLRLELDWLARVIDARFKLYFDEPCDVADVLELEPPVLDPEGSNYARLVRGMGLTYVERLAVILCLTPHVRPRLINVFHTRNQTFERRFTEFGGALQHDAFVPTGETLAWLIGGEDIERRFLVQLLLEHDHDLIREGVLVTGAETSGMPAMQAPLGMSEETLARLTTGRTHRPGFSSAFPAERIGSPLGWDDLVLHPRTRAQIDEIADWIRHGDTLLDAWGMRDKLRPGIRCLFHGPPGTGKTMTAQLLGQATGRDVYRIDLSMVVSKYIGETEKNLARVFDRAQSRGWILFFDEADALFGRRVETRDAHDRYANQEIAYLLQRIESFDAAAILASNQRENIDDAFARRFETIVYFPMPRAEERLRLWRASVPGGERLGPGVDLDALAHDHALSGGSIMNAIRFAALRAIADGERPIEAADLVTGIRRELAKEGRTA